ncbi:MAG: E3 ubiquitin ligase family protein [Spirochaetes bacterium]|nr:E3 ubiquitin ligase family protein [Spirochaetota bacterium]
MFYNFLLLLQGSQSSLSKLVIFIVISIIFFIASVILFIIRKKALDVLLDIKFVQTIKIKNIMENYQSITDQLGKGNYSEYVEIKGVSKCGNPIKSQHTDTDCVWYHSQILREYEETVTTKDSKGYSRTEIRRGSEVVSDITNKTDLEIDDGTGKINVNTDSSEIVSKLIYNQFQPGEYKGMININFSPIFGRRTIGYRYKEEIIPLSQNLYIIGEASDREGRLEIQKPLDNRKKFIVSVKSEEELIKSFNTKAVILLTAGIILMVVGIGFILFGIFTRR